MSTNMKELLEAGVHFGHQTQRWNPKMDNYMKILFTSNLSKYISFLLVGMAWIYIISQGTVY